MRFAIGSVAHETNTFCRGTTPVTAFQEREWLHGDEIVAEHRGVRDYVGGMLAAAERLRIEVAPTFSATTEPSGTIERAAYAAMRDELLAGLRACSATGPVDAVCLALHGAGIAEGVDDLEGDLLAAVRDLVGPDMPVVVTLDLHGNLTQRMVDNADALLGVHFYPHTDSFERGIEAVELAARIVRGEVHPVTVLATLPMMINGATTNLSPARDVNAICAEWEARPGVIDCTFFHGFPYTDIPEVGASIVAIADNDPALAAEAARSLAGDVWEMREAFRTEPVSATEAVRRALRGDGTPVVVNEKSDNPGGGAPGDGTHLLRAMLAANATETAFGFIYDPETAAQAHRAGAGATIDVRLGGKTDDLHGAPIAATAYVKALTDGRFIQQSPMGRGRQVDLGPMARLVIGNVDVLVSSVRTQTLDPEVFLLHGIDVTRYRLVALKSTQHFRAGFEPVAAEIIQADTPGLTSGDVSTFAYHRLRRPIWPLDTDARPDLR
ncbi:MAG TPA: M81 family metallopeptidase [Thermomicrobiaceae bacterium]|nr:M81 family metallopeptidase [Thermomicrobiaceae bacterium]